MILATAEDPPDDLELFRRQSVKRIPLLPPGGKPVSDAWWLNLVLPRSSAECPGRLEKEVRVGAWSVRLYYVWERVRETHVGAPKWIVLVEGPTARDARGYKPRSRAEGAILGVIGGPIHEYVQALEAGMGSS